MWQKAETVILYPFGTYGFARFIESVETYRHAQRLDRFHPINVCSMIMFTFYRTSSSSRIIFSAVPSTNLQRMRTF